jgi:hypothetical protein
MPLYQFPCLDNAYVNSVIDGKIDKAPGNPGSEQSFYHESSWIFQSVLLNDRPAIKQIVDAMKKVYDNLGELKGAGA